MARRRRKKPSTLSRELDPARWAYFVFALGGFVAAWLLSNLFEDAWAIVWGVWPQHIPRADPFVSNMTGIGVAVLGVVLALRKQEWFKFVTEVVVEISQVVWPTKAETRAATIVVIVITLISSGILAAMDSVWSAITDWLYGV